MTSKVWFITGTSKGFGRIWAEAALARGDRVAATARDVATLTSSSNNTATGFWRCHPTNSRSRVRTSSSSESVPAWLISSSDRSPECFVGCCWILQIGQNHSHSIVPGGLLVTS